jgi:hypothetical protein
VLKESFQLYKAVSEGVINLAGAFFEMQYHDASEGEGGRRGGEGAEGECRQQAQLGVEAGAGGASGRRCPAVFALPVGPGPPPPPALLPVRGLEYYRESIGAAEALSAYYATIEQIVEVGCREVGRWGC